MQNLSISSSLTIIASLAAGGKLTGLTPRKGRRWLMVPCLWLSGLVPFVVSVSSSLPLILASRFVLGVVHPILYTLFYALSG